MILLIALDGHAVEDVLAELVLGKVTRRDATRLAGRLTREILCSLAKFELANHEIHRRLLLLGHLREESHRLLLDLLSNIDALGTRTVVGRDMRGGIHQLHKVRAVNDDVGRIDVGNANRLLIDLHIDETINELAEVLLSGRAKRNDVGVRIGVTISDLALGIRIELVLLAILGRLVLAAIGAVLRLGIGIIAVLIALAIGRRTALAVLVTLILSIALAVALGLLLITVLRIIGLRIRLRTLTLLARVARLILLAVLTVLLVARLSLLTVIALRIVLLLFLLLGGVVEILGNVDHIAERNRAVDALDDLLLLIGEGNRNTRMLADLEVQVEAVDETHAAKILALATEGIHLPHGVIHVGEVGLETRKLAHDHLLNARVLNDIHEVLSDRTGAITAVGTRDLSLSGAPLIGGSVERMRHLMTDETVIHGLRLCADLAGVPSRKFKNTIRKIDGRGGRGRVVNNGELLTRKVLCEKVGRGVVERIRHDLSIV